MTQDEAESLAELERQMGLFMHVVLPYPTFTRLVNMAGSITGWDYEKVWSVHSDLPAYRIRIGHAETLRDKIRHRIIERATEKLIGTQK